MFKSRFLLPLLFFVSLIVVSYILLNNVDSVPARNNIKEENINTLKEQKKELASFYQRGWSKEGLFEPTLPNEGTQDEYITYFAYQVAHILGKSPGKVFMRTLQERLTKEDFLSPQSEVSIYSGIERVYVFHQLLNTFPSKDTKQLRVLLQDHIRKLLKGTYSNKGYFLSENKADHNEPTSLEKKLHDTSIMLRLASYYKLLDKVNKQAVRNWVELLPCKGDTVIEQLTEINELLSSSIPIRFDDDHIHQLLSDSQWTMENWIDLYSLSNLYVKKKLKIDGSLRLSLIKRIKQSYFGMQNIHAEFYRLSILKNLDFDVSLNEKQKLLREIFLYVDKEGMFPRISTFNNLYSQAFIGRNSHEKEERDHYDPHIRAKIKEENPVELIERGSLELFPYTSLLKQTGTTLSEGQEKRIVDFLKREVKKPRLKGSQIGWNLYIRALSELNVIFIEDMLPSNTRSILEGIKKDGGSFFGDKSQVSTLAFLEALARTKLFDQELKELEPFIRNVEIKSDAEVAAILLHYKVVLMEELRIPYNKNEVAEKINTLFRGIGYALSSKQSTSDLPSTFFLLELNNKIMECA